MKIKLLLLVLVLGPLHAGCRLSDNLLRTSIIEPIQYSGYWDSKRERAQFQKLARQELEHVRSVARSETDNYAFSPFSSDYEAGFEAGFVDYLMYGGPGQPPALPPRRYWWSACEGCGVGTAMEDWFNGFRHGASIAMNSGIRACVTVSPIGALFTETTPIYPASCFFPSTVEEINSPAPVPASALIPEDQSNSSALPMITNGASPAQVIKPMGPIVESSVQQTSWQSLQNDPSLPTVGEWNFDSKVEPKVGWPETDASYIYPYGTETPWSFPQDSTSTEMWQPKEIETLPFDGRSSSQKTSAVWDSSFRLKTQWKQTSLASNPQLANSTILTRLASDAPIPMLMWLALCSLPIGHRPVASRFRLYSVPTYGLAIGASLKQIAAWVLILGCCLLSGCASLTNPVLNGIPVRKLPPDLLYEQHRDGFQTMPLSLLRQAQPESYILAAGDVLGVYIAGVFPPTSADQPLVTPPVYFPSHIDPLGAGIPPAMGYPVTIRDDGTLALPLLAPIPLEGSTIEEAGERVRRAYTESGILQSGRETVMITLMQPRQIRVLVFRQEIGGFSAGGRGDISSNNVKRGTAHVVDLRAYENDVANALANSGGLPGLDAYDGIYIFRGGQRNPDLTARLQTTTGSEEASQLCGLCAETDYIPTRWPAAAPPPFCADDVILHQGDVILLEARAQDLYYTAGLLPAGERVLPRDYDLDVVEAVIQVSGSLVNGAFGGNNFNGLLIQKGMGNPNPSALTVIRRTPCGGQIPIAVDLNRALVDPRERILVQPGDVLILQSTKHESISRYFNDLLNVNFLWKGFEDGNWGGSAALRQASAIAQ
ncbi:MAG: polysaccharide biosynthesis/export family protein [Planctomycetales bacterium]|nr:polysaccharide biosynthesis/export family protein [Planctomycetales bacterium]